MKVLWITNILFPAPSNVLGISNTPFGGWMLSSLNALRSLYSDVKFAVATVYSGNEYKIFDIGDVKYFLLPSSKDITTYDNSLEPIWMSVRSEFEPDVVHIHGTEFAPGLSYIKACGPENVCISIQGLVSVYARYYYASISTKDIIKNITLRDILRFDTIFHQKRKFEKRGELEIEYIKSVSHILGRTAWDKSQVWAINPEAKYHFCNETLRSVFYQHKWEYGKCDKHTIFISQASYPIKGLHKVLEAMPFVLRYFPDARIKIAGHNIIDKPFWRISGYGKYVRSLIRKYSLEDKIEFLGTLSESEMCSAYLNSNVFVCPSSIENSPNSLGEAQLLGVPHLASYVGGVSDMMIGYDSDLYRFEEVEMLAKKVCSIFQKSEFTYNNIAKDRYDSVLNAQKLYAIYESIV